MGLIPKEYSGRNRGTYHMTPKQEVFRVVDMYTSGIYIQLADTRILEMKAQVLSPPSGSKEKNSRILKMPILQKTKCHRQNRTKSNNGDVFPTFPPKHLISTTSLYPASPRKWTNS